MDDIRKKLITVNLRYGEVSVPLRARAFAQLIQKVLFLNEGGLRQGEIRTPLADIVGRPNIAERSVIEAISLLRQGRIIEKTEEGKWCLSKVHHREIQQAIERAEKRRTEILQRHFPSAIPGKQLRDWFEDACIAFFVGYGDLIVSLLSRGAVSELRRHSLELDEILKTTIEKHKLGAYERQLRDGFEGFIRSTERQDQEELMNITQAMIACRFVASDIGGDPLVLEEFKDAIILLDTNVLFAATLEKHKIARSLEALGGALGAIGVDLKFVYPTKEEYENTVAYQREQVITAVEKFSKDVLEGARDLFLKTALARGCVSREDFERFFREIEFPPREFSEGTSITLVDNPDIKSTAEEGMRDAGLKAQIRIAPSPTRRNRPKGENTVNHDAALVYIVERARREGKNVWVLTLDTGMQNLSAERAGEHGFPLWISIEALLQILAVDSEGTNVDPTDFAPLLSRILDAEYFPSQETYTSEDLCILVEREGRITSLPDEKIKEAAHKIRRAILQGKRRGDPELTLMIQREFQGYLLDGEEELKKTKEEAGKERKTREFTEQKISRMRDKMLSDRVKSIRVDTFVSLGKILVLVIIIGWISFQGSRWIIGEVLNKLEAPWSFILSLAPSIVTTVIILITGKVKNLIVRLLNASQEAKQDLKKFD